MKRVFVGLIAAISFSVLFISCTNHSQGERQAKYIFYFIGDGLSATQVNLAEAFSVEGSGGVKRLNISTLPATGFATTNAANRYITCSAAAGTALASGYKTNINRIGVDPQNKKSLKSIAEMARDKGMKVGIVSSVSIDHATPAVFYAHTADRNNYNDIGNQLLESGFDYFAGGSLRWDKREDDYFAYRQKAEAKGFEVITTRGEFDSLSSGQSAPVIATLNMLWQGGSIEDGSSLPYAIDLKYSDLYDYDNRITLADFTRKGIEVLDNEHGFFLMVEGGKIDWACHANDAATAIHEILDFDNAVAQALAFAQRYPDETLIVVTADHETGGLTLGFAGTGYDTSIELLAGQRVSFQQYSNNVKSKIKAAESFEQLLSYAGESLGFLDRLSSHQIALLRSAYRQSREGVVQGELNTRADDMYVNIFNFGGYDPFTTISMQILNHLAGVDFATYAHTAVPVPVYAKGVGEELFVGSFDNTDIPKRIMKIGGLK